jgi:hypothetical protein
MKWTDGEGNVREYPPPDPGEDRHLPAPTPADVLASRFAVICGLPDLKSSMADIRGLGAKSGRAGWDFRHAVCLVDQHDRCLPLTPSNRALARDLLIEYGAARGGAPVDLYPRVEIYDYARFVGYGMAFVGGPTEPMRETRLQIPPRVGREPLRDMEEKWVIW